ncbi:hypothetical protein [Hydrogenophaga sp. PBL-H3]|uniref:hypothetical protein n=1 Tax=Hydrogenophaga sp. PBL-H3 TaxID=434010 RepID=UPI00131F73C2|nr:hypothetical protein [Hydrogenophaga sp. PBL-H3]QHE77031.1 hypothetical protein F9Z45_13730 [Hydrogenophaga sp. PBL-H3]QHE81455.1 hypothetical protein F9Z44_13730 [Hydrogenophaga sp. PBL-H3]
MTINITQAEDAAGGLEPNTATVVTSFDFWAADMARKALIEQLGLAMLAAHSADDKSEMNRYKDLMYAEIKRISPQAANSRHAEIDHEIGNVPPIVQQQHARRRHAIEEPQ